MVSKLILPRLVRSVQTAMLVWRKHQLWKSRKPSTNWTMYWAYWRAQTFSIHPRLSKIIKGSNNNNLSNHKKCPMQPSPKYKSTTTGTKSLTLNRSSWAIESQIISKIMMSHPNCKISRHQFKTSRIIHHQFIFSKIGHPRYKFKSKIDQ